MISLLIIYISIIIFYFVFIHFGNSLESVQYFHNRLLELDYGTDLKWNDEFNESTSLMLLKYCVMSSVIYSERQPDNYQFIIRNKIHKIYGYTFTHLSQNVGFIEICDNHAIISLVSTACLSDVLFSATNQLIDIEDGKIHEGYYVHTLEFMSSILTLLNPSIKNVYITGHSLGGALSSIVGYLLSKYFNYNCVVYTFGSPKFGDSTLKRFIENVKSLKIYNTLNTSDLVINKPSNKSYVRIGTSIEHSIDTGNNNVNHGIKVYREIVLKNQMELSMRPHRFDEILSRILMDVLS